MYNVQKFIYNIKNSSFLIFKFKDLALKFIMIIYISSHT